MMGIPGDFSEAWQDSDRTKRRRAKAPRKKNSSVQGPVTRLALFHNRETVSELRR